MAPSHLSHCHVTSGSDGGTSTAEHFSFSSCSCDREIRAGLNDEVVSSMSRSLLSGSLSMRGRVSRDSIQPAIESTN